MSKFAVAYINWFDHDLSIEIIESDTWYTALLKHSCLLDSFDIYEDLINDGNFEIQDWKMRAFDCDSMIDVVEITAR
jgi:hypothetical protein